MEAGQTRCKGERDKGHHPLEAIPGPWYFSVTLWWAHAELVFGKLSLGSLPATQTDPRKGGFWEGGLPSLIPTAHSLLFHLAPMCVALTTLRLLIPPQAL